GNLNRAAANTGGSITNLGARSGGGGGGLSGPPEISALDRARTSLLKTQRNATRVASIRAGQQQFSPSPIGSPGVLVRGGINDPGGTGAARPSASPLNSGTVITNRSLTGKKSVSSSFAKPLNVSSTFF
ncbi:hypothetical protein LCGC14_2987100, partial [marine sediment metagenome]